MSGVLVDSDILIEVLRGRKLEVTRLWADTVAADTAAADTATADTATVNDARLP